MHKDVFVKCQHKYVNHSKLLTTFALPLTVKMLSPLVFVASLISNFEDIGGIETFIYYYINNCLFVSECVR